MEDKLHVHKVSLGTFAKKLLASKKPKVEKINVPSPVIPQGPMVGHKVRVVCEKVHEAYGATATVKRHDAANSKITISLDCELAIRKYVVAECQVEILKHVCAKMPKKSMVLSAPERVDLRCRFIDMIEDKGAALTMNQRLSGEHLQLLDWMSRRDCRMCEGSKLVSPVIVHQLLESTTIPGVDAAEFRKKAWKVLTRQFKIHGLLGIPVWTSPSDPEAHWTLLVLRKLCTAIKVTYWDSAQIKENEVNRSAASTILTFFKEEFEQMQWPEELPERSNSRSRQADGINCGMYIGYYWESEMRQFNGEGWSMEFPTWNNKGPVQEMKRRLCSLVVAVRKMKLEQATLEVEKDKEKEAGCEIEDLIVLPDAKITETKLALTCLKKLAEKSFNQGSVDFFGCSKCRWARVGCIDWKCNPTKFDAHFEEHPEKYEGKELKDILSLTNKELIGGGCQVCFFW